MSTDSPATTPEQLRYDAAQMREFRRGPTWLVLTRWIEAHRRDVQAKLLREERSESLHRYAAALNEIDFLLRLPDIIIGEVDRLDMQRKTDEERARAR